MGLGSPKGKGLTRQCFLLTTFYGTSGKCGQNIGLARRSWTPGSTTEQSKLQLSVAKNYQLSNNRLESLPTPLENPGSVIAYVLFLYRAILFKQFKKSFAAN